MNREKESFGGGTSPSAVPRRLGKYEILARIGAGGMAAVYQARDTESDRVVALKVLPREVAKPSWIRRFSREAFTSARMNHPNVIDVFEFNEDRGLYYIAMEYVDGIDVDSYVHAKGKLDAAEAIDIIAQAARALEHAHAHGVVHRDVKPSNLLLSQVDGRRTVKLADLGLARDLLTEEQARLTKPGSTLGTLDYMAPEQARGGHLADIRSDLYSLGCTFYHLLTGHAPFAGATLTEKLYRQVHVMPPDPREDHPGLSESVIAILGRLLQKQPEDRYQTPTELLVDLERELHGYDSSPRDAIASLADSVAESDAARAATGPRIREPFPPLCQSVAGSSGSEGGSADELGAQSAQRSYLAARWFYLAAAGVMLATGALLLFLLSR